MSSCSDSHESLSCGPSEQSSATSWDEYLNSATYISIKPDLDAAVKDLGDLENHVFSDEGPIPIMEAIAALESGDRPFLEQVGQDSDGTPIHQWRRWPDPVPSPAPKGSTKPRAIHPTLKYQKSKLPFVGKQKKEENLRGGSKPPAVRNTDNDETRMCAFFNDIINHIMEHVEDKYKTDLEPRQWSGKFATEPLGTTDHPRKELCSRMPDGTLWPAGVAPHCDGRSKVRAFCELKGSTDPSGQPSVLSQLAENVRLTFAAEPFRRFILGMSLVESRLLRLYRFDRSGVLVSWETDIKQTPGYLVAYLLQFAFATDETLGMDPTISTVTDGSGKTHRYIYVGEPEKKKFEIKEILFTSRDIRGRGTACFRVWDEEHERYRALKDAWMDQRRRGTEKDYLDQAKKSNVEGIAHLIAYEEVHINGDVDSTETIRKALIDDAGVGLASAQEDVDEAKAEAKEAKAEVKEAKEEAEDKIKVAEDKLEVAEKKLKAAKEAIRAFQATIKLLEKAESRIHHRLVFDECGVPLEKFASLKELVSVICDAIKAHAALFEGPKILHRDISMRNILICVEASLASSNAETRPGMLIDFDYAVYTDGKAGTSPRGEKTGTPPFMAAMLLQDPINNPHTAEHDLESFFYVLVWICIVYSGPGGQERKAPFQFEESYLCNWVNGADTTRGFLKMSNFVQDNQFQKLLGEFHPYFDALKPLIKELKSAIFDTTAPLLSFTHEAIIKILEDAKKGLTDPSGELVDRWTPSVPRSGTKRSSISAQLDSLDSDRLFKRRNTTPSASGASNLEPVDGM